MRWDNAMENAVEIGNGECGQNGNGIPGDQFFGRTWYVMSFESSTAEKRLTRRERTGRKKAAKTSRTGFQDSRIPM